MKKNCLFLLIILWYCLTPKLAFTQNPLTINDCLRLAFENSRLIKMADLSVKIAEEKITETEAQRLPSLNFNSMYTRIGKITSFTIPTGSEGEKQTFQFGTPNRINFDLKMQFAVFSWGRISNTIAISQIGKGLTTIHRKQNIIDITDQVLRAFYSVLLNEEIIRLHEVNVYRANNHLQVAEKRFVSGLVAKLELLRAQVQLKNNQNNLEESKGNLAKSKIFLGKILGRNDELISVQGALTFKPLSVDNQDIIERALSSRLDLQIFQFQHQINQSQIKLTRSGNKPSLFFFSSYNVQNGFDPMNPERFIDNWNVGVQLTIPIFNGFSINHKVQQAKLDLENTLLQEKEIRDLIKMQIRQVLVTIKQSEDKIENQKQNIVLAKEALQVAETQYQNGLVSSLDVIDAQQTLSQSELIYTQAIFNHIIAKLDLCNAMGDYSWFESILEK